MNELWSRPIESLAPDLRSGKLSPVDLTEAYLARIAAVDPLLDSFIHVSADAREAARTAEREIAAGRWRGPLHGIPVGVKDNYLTADMPTTAGSTAEGLAFPMRDAAAVARLRAAGAVPIGKTRTHEFAWGNVTPPVHNPWDLSRVPSGSSGGSAAAVAGGLCAAGLGSDTGGSIRMPASACGLVGLKPTFGRVSRDGIVPHSWSLDHAGSPDAHRRRHRDAPAGARRLRSDRPRLPGPARPRLREEPRKTVKGMTIGVCRNHFFDGLQDDVARATEAAIDDLAKAGARIVEFEIPLLAHGLGAIFAIELASSTAYHDESLRAGRVPQFQPDVRTLVEMGRLVTGADYLKAEQYRSVLMEAFSKVLATVDVIVGPTTPITAWKRGEWTVQVGDRPESVLAASWRFTYPYNLTGLPAISLPCGFDRDGLPIGLQIAGRPFDEPAVLRVAHAYERAHDWKDRRPTLTVE